MDWEFFDYDPDTRTRVMWRLLEDGRAEFAIEQNVDLILAANVEAEKETHGKRFGDWNRIGSVPLRMVEKTGLDVAVDMRDQKFISKFFNDSDNAKLRTSRGRV